MSNEAQKALASRFTKLKAQCNTTPKHLLDQANLEPLMQDFFAAIKSLIASDARITSHSTVTKALQAPLAFLSSRKLTVNFKDINNETALHWAARAGNIEVVKLFLTHGAHAQIQNKDGETALHRAVRLDNTEVVKLFLKKCAKVTSIQNKDGETALHFAVANGNEGIIKLLLGSGTDINAKSKDGETALHFAVANNNKGIARLLLEHGIDANIQEKTGETALHFAVGKDEGIVKSLLEYGIDTNAKNADGNTALHFAAQEGNEDTLRLLLKYGIDANAKNENNETALHIAVANNKKGTVRLLLEHKVDANIQESKGETALHFAVANSHEDIVRLLLEHEVEIDARTKSGETALQYAIKKEAATTIEILLQGGAPTFSGTQDLLPLLEILDPQRQQELQELRNTQLIKTLEALYPEELKKELRNTQLITTLEEPYPEELKEVAARNKLCDFIFQVAPLVCKGRQYYLQLQERIKKASKELYGKTNPLFENKLGLYLLGFQVDCLRKNNEPFDTIKHHSDQVLDKLLEANQAALEKLEPALSHLDSYLDSRLKQTDTKTNSLFKHPKLASNSTKKTAFKEQEFIAILENQPTVSLDLTSKLGWEELVRDYSIAYLSPKLSEDFKEYSLEFWVSVFSPLSLKPNVSVSWFAKGCPIQFPSQDIELSNSPSP